MKLISHFMVGGVNKQVEYVESYEVAKGVNCDTYRFVDDDSQDLAIIKVDPHYSTPLQKVLTGDKTVEGYISGEGVLKIDNLTYDFPGDLVEVEVSPGQIMQWSTKSGLTFYEICKPPYKDGRFQNLN